MVVFGGYWQVLEEDLEGQQEGGKKEELPPPHILSMETSNQLKGRLLSPLEQHVRASGGDTIPPRPPSLGPQSCIFVLCQSLKFPVTVLLAGLGPSGGGQQGSLTCHRTALFESFTLNLE